MPAGRPRQDGAPYSWKIPHHQNEYVKKKAAKLGISRIEVIRRIIDKAIEEEKKSS